MIFSLDMVNDIVGSFSDIEHFFRSYVELIMRRNVGLPLKLFFCWNIANKHCFMSRQCTKYVHTDNLFIKNTYKYILVSALVITSIVLHVLCNYVIFVQRVSGKCTVFDRVTAVHYCGHRLGVFYLEPFI